MTEKGKLKKRVVKIEVRKRQMKKKGINNEKERLFLLFLQLLMDIHIITHNIK